MACASQNETSTAAPCTTPHAPHAACSSGKWHAGLSRKILPYRDDATTRHAREPTATHVLCTCLDGFERFHLLQRQVEHLEEDLHRQAGAEPQAGCRGAARGASGRVARGGEGRRLWGQAQPLAHGWWGERGRFWGDEQEHGEGSRRRPPLSPPPPPLTSPCRWSARPQRRGSAAGPASCAAEGGARRGAHVAQQPGPSTAASTLGG
jgi:hypothetical protein